MTTFSNTALLAFSLMLTTAPATPWAAATPGASSASPANAASAAETSEPDPARDQRLRERSQESQGSVVVKGQRIAYQAIAGLLPIDDHSEEPGAVMSYVAYFRKVEPGAPPRPVIFLYNGGPGSSTMWLHLGAFGPKRIVTGNGLRAPSAPYPLVDNEYCLLDAGDLVFIDAPGTGFGRIVAVDKDKSKEPEKRKALEKDFWSVDPDAKAFAHFITRFLTRYKRWNAPKYLFGESYGTTRSAMLVERLQSQESVDVNGVILLSQILNLGNSIDEPQFAPGDDMPYVLALPTYAATAWYHRKLPAHAERSPEALQSLLAEVRRFALGDYLQALAAGNAIDPAVKHATAQRLAGYIGLPVAYLEKADLRVNGGMFTNTLLGDEGQSVGRLDTRYAGPSLDRLAKESDYDPQSAAISSAYVSAYNDYVRNTLKFGADLVYKPSAEVWSAWEWKHRPPGAEHPMQNTLNVMPDLAAAMSRNPKLRVSVHAGIFDLATPFFAAEYELDHLPIGASLRANIEVHRYPAGHMMYDDPASLSTLHDSVAKFVRETDNLAH